MSGIFLGRERLDPITAKHTRHTEPEYVDDQF